MKQDCPSTDGCLSWMMGIPSGFICKIFHLKKEIKEKGRREEEEGREGGGEASYCRKNREKMVINTEMRK